MVDHGLLEPGLQLLRCSDHLACLCSLMLTFISWFRLVSLGSAGLLLLIRSRSSIRFAVVVGTALNTLGILPAGMCILAAFCIIFLNVISLLRTLLVTGVFAKRSSVMAVKDVQSAFLKLIKVLFGASTFWMMDERRRVMGRWSELREVSTFQLQVGIQSAVAMEMSGAVAELPVMRVGVSSFSMPRPASPTQSANMRPLASSLSSVCHKALWALKSPRRRKVSPSPSLRLGMLGA